MTPEDLCRVTVNVHCAAEHVAEVHEELGPQAAAVAAALTLLNSPTIYSYCPASRSSLSRRS